MEILDLKEKQKEDFKGFIEGLYNFLQSYEKAKYSFHNIPNCNNLITENSDTIHTVTLEPEEPKLYNNKSLTEYLGVSEKTLKKYRDQGLIAFTQVQDKFWYTQNDVDDFIRKHRYEAFNSLQA